MVRLGFGCLRGHYDLGPDHISWDHLQEAVRSLHREKKQVVYLDPLLPSFVHLDHHLSTEVQHCRCTSASSSIA